MFDFVVTILLSPFALILASLWGISVLIKNVSFIDGFWPLGFVLLSWFTAAEVGVHGTAQQVILALVTLWGMRLSYYLFTRYTRDGEDKRYIAMMQGREGLARHAYSFFIVFGLQGVLMMLINTPVVDTLLVGNTALTPLSYAGIVLFLLGFYFEVVGDLQLKKFKADPASAGKVLNTGLWRYTRHPNYFGDACIWWGLWLIGANFSYIFAPIIMTLLLAKGSGVPILERTLKQTRPAYKNYIESTSSFIPWMPKG